MMMCILKRQGLAMAIFICSVGAARCTRGAGVGQQQQERQQRVTRKAVRSKRVRTNGLCERPRRVGRGRGTSKEGSVVADGTGRDDMQGVPVVFTHQIAPSSWG